MHLIVFDQIGSLFAGKKRRPPSVTKFAGIAVERHPRIIGDLLAAAGQRIEQRSLAAVRRATNAKWKVPAITRRCGLSSRLGPSRARRKS